MRAPFGIDGRFTSREHQYRTWLALNEFFKDQGPDPPDPGPDPPAGSGNVVYYYQGEYVGDLLIKDGIGSRIRYEQAGLNLPDPVPFFVFSGEKEVVNLYTYIVVVEDPVSRMILSYGVFDASGQYVPHETWDLHWNPDWPKEFLLVELFACDGERYVYYQNNIYYSIESESDPIQDALTLDRFEYDRAAGEVPAVCFYGATAIRESGTEGFVGAISASIKPDL